MGGSDNLSGDWLNADTVALAAVLACIALVFVYTMRTGSSPVPTSPRVRQTVLDLVPMATRGVVYELGAGWGTLAIPLARRLPGCTVIAYEISPLPWLISRLRLAFGGLPNLTIRRADYRTARLGDAAVVVCYLGPDAMDALKTKFEAELTPGCLVVSNFFAVPGWQAEEERTAPDVHRSKVYRYRVRQSS